MNKIFHTHKKIIIYVFVLSSLLTFSSCHADPNDDSSSLANQFIDHYVQEAQEKEKNSLLFDMEEVGTDGGFHVFRDTTTDVMYLWAKAGYAGGLTVMLDPETGLPLTYSRFLELSNDNTVKGQ